MICHNVTANDQFSSTTCKAHDIHRGAGRDGEWTSWIEANVPFITVRTADRYRLIFRRFAEFKTLMSHFELTALHELSKAKTPKKAILHAIQEARNGDFVSAHEARCLVRTFSSPQTTSGGRKRPPRSKPMELNVKGGTAIVKASHKNAIAALEDAIKQLRKGGENPS